MTALDINKAFFWISSLQVFQKQLDLFPSNQAIFKLWSQSMLISTANRTKQRLYWQSIHASMNFTKLETFYTFALKFLLLNQSSLSFLMYIRTNLKSFSYITCDKNWKHSVKLCYQQISNPLQPVRVMFFSLQLQFR